MLARMVLSNIYRITQEKFQYHRVEIYTTLRAYTLYQMLFDTFNTGYRLKTSYIFIRRGTGIFHVLNYI